MDETRGNRDDGKVKISPDEMYLMMQNDIQLQQKRGIRAITASCPEDALSSRDRELAELHCDTPAGVRALDLEHSGNTMLQRLSAEREVSQAERERASHWLHQGSGTQRRQMEEQPAQVRADVNRAEMHSRGPPWDEVEEERSSEVVRLQNQLKEKKAAGQHVSDRYVTDASNHEMQLRVLGPERETYLAQLAQDHEAGEEHREQIRQVQQQLETRRAHGDHFYSYIESHGENVTMCNAHKEHKDQEGAGEHRETGEQDQGGSFASSQDHLMEKYLVSAALRDNYWVEDHGLLEQAGNSWFRHHCEDLLNGSASLSSGSQDLDGSSEEEVDLGKALLVQQCRDLATQLQDREKQLEMLRDETRSSGAELREALGKRDEATKALASVQRHLEAERELRLRCEDVIRRETQEGDDLKARLNYLQSQLERKERARDETLDLITELREENELLLVQLRGQEQLVRDVQEQKVAGDSVASEVQALFGRQLSVLQEQRDRLQGMLDLQQAKNLTSSELLGQRTMELDSSLKEVKHLQAQLAEREESMLRTSKDKKELESRLSCLQQDLVNAEQELSRRVEEQVAQESRVVELEIRAKDSENTLETVQADFQNQLEAKDLELLKLTAEREKAQAEHQEKVSALHTELARITESLRDQDRVHAVAMETLLQNEAEKSHSAVEEAEAQLRRVHQEEAGRLEEKHQEQVNELNEQMQRKQSELKAALGEEHKNRITLIKQVHEREHQREMAELAGEQEAALSRLGAELKESMEAAHQAELHQAQTEQALELEALRLSLTNQHAAQLELYQSAQQRDKEVALAELQDSLRAGWSQDSAQLQTQQQAELERLREQNREQNRDQARRVELQHQQEKDDLDLAWESRVLKEKTRMEELQANQIEALREEWQSESGQALEELRSSLMETQEALSATRAQLEELQACRELELQRLEEELSRARSEHDDATRENANLVASHQGALQEQQDRAQRLEELCSASAEREQQLQQQVERLQAEHVTLKSSSEQEVGHLWTQLECMRVSRQELEDLREQLLARSVQGEEVEQLRRQFSQQRREIQQQNEAELENLRAYFEQRLRSTEESYREEVILLQHRLVEGAEESAAPQEGDGSFLCEENVDEDKADMLAEINMKLQNHKEELDSLRLQLEERHKQELEHLRASVALAYREELLQVKTDLTDRYFSQIQDLKTKHSLELEQQRAKLSDSHVKEISRLRLRSAQDAARQVERELEERGRASAEEHRARMAQVRSEKGRIQSLEAQVAALLKSHEEHLEQVEEQCGELVRKAEEKLKQDFVRQLHVAVLKAQVQEREKMSQELSQEKAEELGRLSEELRSQAEGRLSALREGLERAAAEEHGALEEQVRGLQEQLEEERRRARSPRDSPESERDPRVLAAKRKIEAQFERELFTAKRLMVVEVKELNTLLLEQAEVKLQEAQRRFEKEQKELEGKLGEKQETALCELAKKHSEELQSQKALLDEHVRSLERLELDHQNLEERLTHKHGAELNLMRADLQAKHKAELDSLSVDLHAKHKTELDSAEAELRERSRAQLEAREAEIRARLKEDRDELEARMLSNMDTLESTYLAEIQSARDERDGTLQALRMTETGHAAELDRLRTHNQAQLGLICIELRRELDLVLMDKSPITVSELGKVQKLSAEASGLGEELEEEPGEESTETDSLDTLLQPGDGPAQELGDLLSKLRTDLRSVAEERRGRHEAHRQLQEVLQVVVRRTVATEEEIRRRFPAYVEPGVNCGGEENGEAREALPDPTLCSDLTEEGLASSQRPSETLFFGLGLEPEVEEVVLGASVRLRSAVDRLLDLLQSAQLHLEEQLSQSRKDSDPLDLQRQRHRPPEQLDLHKGPVECHTEEKAALEEVLQQKETQVQELEEELDRLQAELQELREERALLLRQRETLAEPLGDTEKALLEEAQRLLQEKVDVQRQAEKDWGRLASRLRLMEAEVEEQDGSRLEAEQQQRAQVEDLQLQIRALEKQLRHHRQFIDEQTVEREQEREEFQLEIQKLEAELRRPFRPRPGGGGKGDKIEDLVLQVENLRAAIKEKTEDYDRVLVTKEKYRGDVSEQNEQIHKMVARICELEQALSSRTQSSQTLAQLDVLQDKETLQQQLCSSCLQVYVQQCQPDEPRHWPIRTGAEEALNEQLEALQVELHTANMEQVQMEQLEQEQKDSAARPEESLLWKSTNQNSVYVSQIQYNICSIKENEYAMCRLPEADGEKGSSSLLLDPVNQLEEKNQEIQRLGEEILRLLWEADASEDQAAELEELRSQVEHLLSDRERLRQDREVEVERLHEVIHKLQEELEQMGPMRHEVSTSPECSLAPCLLHTPRGLEDSLRQELTRHAPLPEPRGEPDPVAARKEVRGDAGRTRAEEERGGPRGGTSQREMEAELLHQLEDEGRKGHAPLLGAEPLLRQAEEGWEGVHAGEEEAQEGHIPAETLRTVLKAPEAHVREGKTESHDLEREEEELRQGKGQLQEEVEKLRQEVTSKGAHIQHLNTELGERMTQAVDLREVLTLAEETLAKAEAALRENEEHLAQVKVEHEALKEEHEALKEEHEALKEDHEALKVEHEALKEEHEALKEEHDALKEEHEALKEEHEALKENHEALKVEHEALKEDHEALKQEHEALKEEHEALKEELEALKVEHEALKVEHEALKEEHEALKEEHEALKEEHEALKEEHEALKEEHDSLEIKFVAVQQTEGRALSDLAGQQGELERQRESCSLWGTTCARHGDPGPGGLCKAGSFPSGLCREGSLRSPELLRMLDAGDDPAPGLQSPQQSELSSLYMKASPLARGASQPPEDLSTPFTRSISASGSLSTLDSRHAKQVKTLDDRYFTGFEEWTSDGYVSSISLDQDTTLQEHESTEEGLNTSFLEYLHSRAVAVANRIDSATESVDQDTELLCPELQGLLKRVYREGHRVLSLSEHPVPVTVTTPSPHQAPPLTWQAERRALQRTVLSLRELLCKMADREPKLDCGDTDMRRELLQAVHSVFHTEMATLRSDLQAVLTAAGPQQLTAVMDQLEMLLKQQEEQWRQHLEQLLSADRLGLRGEVQDLRSLLCSSSLRSQEQLRLLQASLRVSRGEGSQCQRVDLLESHLTVRELGGTDQHSDQRAEQPRGAEQKAQLWEEQTGGAEHKAQLWEEHTEGAEHKAQLWEENTGGAEHKAQLWEEHTRGVEHKAQLWEEHTGGAEQKAQLWENNGTVVKRVQLSTASESHQELHRTICNDLRSSLGSVETEGQACQEAERREQAPGQQLQSEEPPHSQRRCDEDQQELQVLQLSLEEHATQVSLLRVAVEQTRTENRSLRSQLRSEEARCEELVSQESGRASEALARLEDERASRARERRDHARNLQEEARRHEEAASQDRKFIQELRAQLEQERRQGEELAASTERLHQRAIQTKRRLEEEEAQGRREAAQREQEAEAAANRLQALRQEAALGLEAERRRADGLQAQLDLLREEARSAKEERRKRGRQEAHVERERKHSTVSQALYPDCVSLSEKLALHKQRAALQAAVRNAEIDLQLTAEIKNQPFYSKMKRLYCKFLRAESYRKSLVYQKKYLLLLLGGFLDSEQTTLALIANMGACPSPEGPLAPPPQPGPTRRFRAAAHVVIAVSRLSFLVRKWQMAFRIGPSETAPAREPGYRAGPGIKTEAQRRQRLSAVQNTIPTCGTQPHSMGHGHSFGPVRQVTLQAAQQVQQQNRQKN
ncbi:hypothetical protein SKAU_G00256020 [Synaphobranchus kaupii]|uniref:Pericentrin/AKAP-450 centrosomal targeting domain-containing protein n=1 Tax=Synaphobranchus kaupii TaxID=118154 RepID=A0A9Q1F3R6_SYNKA|nr:hypothetical protein SKAU_G00256020 [Synaphobranchus kaupii]